MAFNNLASSFQESGKADYCTQTSSTIGWRIIIAQSLDAKSNEAAPLYGGLDIHYMVDLGYRLSYSA